MQQVHVMMGLPGSGKTTWAKEEAEKTGAMIIGRDSIRHMLKHSHNYDSSERGQEYVWDVSQFMIKTALKRKFDVILDQLSLTKKQRRETLELIREYAPLAKVSLVWCAEENLNVQRRMNSDMIWGDEEYYVELIEKLKDSAEEPRFDEGFDSIAYIPSEEDRIDIDKQIKINEEKNG